VSRLRAIAIYISEHTHMSVDGRENRAGFNWWKAWGPVYLSGTGRLQQLYD